MRDARWADDDNEPVEVGGASHSFYEWQVDAITNATYEQYGASHVTRARTTSAGEWSATRVERCAFTWLVLLTASRVEQSRWAFPKHIASRGLVAEYLRKITVVSLSRIAVLWTQPQAPRRID